MMDRVRMGLARVVGSRPHRTDSTGANEAVAPSRRPASVTPDDRRVQIAAAKARITLDRLTGDSSPEWIIALSKEKPE